MLEEYVDLSCLPDELGGYDSFNVNEWVEYTTVKHNYNNYMKDYLQIILKFG